MILLQWPPLRRLFVVYRLLVASYALTVTFVSIQLHPRSLLPWPVWLTNWSYFLLTCHLLCAALIVLLNACFECQSAVPPAYDSTSIPCYIKLNWFLFSVATPAAVVVTTVFFTSIFPRLHQDYLNAENANLHVMNTVLVILEFTVSAFPVRMLHMVYVWLYGLAYLIFSTIYWAVDHSNVMYPGVLDWNVPITTAVVILVLFVIGIPLVQFILFNIYQLRLYIYTPACRQFHG